MARNSQVRLLQTDEGITNVHILKEGDPQWQWFFKHPQLLLTSEVAHLVVDMGQGNLKAIIIVNSNTQPAAAAVLKTDSGVICVSSEKQKKSESKLFYYFMCWLSSKLVISYNNVYVGHLVQFCFCFFEKGLVHEKRLQVLSGPHALFGRNKGIL